MNKEVIEMLLPTKKSAQVNNLEHHLRDLEGEKPNLEKEGSDLHAAAETSEWENDLLLWNKDAQIASLEQPLRDLEEENLSLEKESFGLRITVQWQSEPNAANASFSEERDALQGEISKYIERLNVVKSKICAVTMAMEGRSSLGHAARFSRWKWSC